MSNKRRNRKTVSFGGISLPVVAIPAVLGLLGIGGFLYWRKKKADEETETLAKDAAAALPASTSAHETSVVGTRSPATVVGGTSSMVTSPDVKPPAILNFNFIQKAPPMPTKFVSPPFVLPPNYSNGEYRPRTPQSVVDYVKAQYDKEVAAGEDTTGALQWIANYDEYVRQEKAATFKEANSRRRIF